MRRILATVALLAVVSVCLMAGPEQQAAADTYRRGQDPVAGYSAMYCSTMHNLSVTSKDTINAPAGFRITNYEIWACHSISQVMNLKFFMYFSAADTCSTDVDIRFWSATGELEESFWYWQFPVSCERIIMSGGTFDGAWSSCVYLMRYGSGAGITGATHPWKRQGVPQ